MLKKLETSWFDITILSFYSRQIKIMWPKLISSSFSLVCSQLPKCLARNVTTTSARLGTFEPDYLDVSIWREFKMNFEYLNSKGDPICTRFEEIFPHNIYFYKIFILLLMFLF